jgi:glycosidase
MRAAMMDAMIFWVEQGVDGFRCDAASMVPDDFWQAVIPRLKSRNPNIILLAEDASKDQLNSGFDMIYGWPSEQNLYKAYDTKESGWITYHQQYEANENRLPTGKHLLRFSTNHDRTAWEFTPVSRTGSQQGALQAFAITLFFGDVPLLYGSQEVGQETSLSFFREDRVDWTKNPDILSAYRDLLQYYATSDLVKHGQEEYFGEATQPVVCFRKSLQGNRFIMLANISDQSVTYEVPQTLQGDYSDILSDEPVTLTESIALAPHQFVMMDRTFHSADLDQSATIELSELLEIVDVFNATEPLCDRSLPDDASSENELDICLRHSSDFNPRDNAISLSELLRLLQLFNASAYIPCADGEDGFCLVRS